MSKTTSQHETSQALRRRILLAVCLLLIVVGTLVFPFPMQGRLWGDLFDLAHAPVFCVSLICLTGFFDPQAIGLPSRFRTIVSMTFSRVIVISGVVMCVGLVGEYLQKFAGRNPSWGDVFANSVGIVAGVCWIAARKLSGFSGKLLALAVPGILIGVSVRPALEAWDSIEGMKAFPLLASFERPRETGNWLPHHSSMSRTNEWSTHDDYSLKVDLHPAEYPGIAMLWVPSTWADYRQLKLDIGNPGDQELQLVLKIQDEQNRRNNLDYHDRFHQEVLVAASSTAHVVVDLARVRAAPENREMNMNEINLIDIFGIDVTEPGTFYIDNVRLAK